MDSVTLGHAGTLVFDQADLRSYETPALRVTAILPGLQAARRVEDLQGRSFEDLAVFFEDLALNWRGWAGTRHWESLERDLRLSAAHDGHVSLSFILTHTSALYEWQATGEISVEPGEELAAFARDLRALLTV